MQKMATTPPPRQRGFRPRPGPGWPALLAVLALLLWLAGCSAAVPEPARAGAPIDRSEYLAVDGARLFLQTRAVDGRAPVLLWLHGGPGGAERPLFRYFNADLEKHFVVAYWDQRGAGRSFDPAADPHRLTVARHVADLDAVVGHLRQASGQDKVVLMGHSWGATLGLLYAQAHPDEVAAFIGVAPLVSSRAAQQSQHDFVRSEALRRHDDSALQQLAALGPPPYPTATQVLAVDALAQRYGAVFHVQPNQAWVVVSGIFKGLVTPWEIARFIYANKISLEAMTPELLALDLRQAVTQVGMPVFFFLGRHDRHVDATLAARYLADLRAPCKGLAWFEQSAHNIPFEEPALFNATVLSALQSVGIQ